MTEDDKQTTGSGGSEGARRSRRAERQKRRQAEEQKQADSGAGEREEDDLESDAAGDVEESSSEHAEDGERDADEPDADAEPADEAENVAAAPRKKKKKKQAAEAADAELSTADIRDRNKRLRAEAAQRRKRKKERKDANTKNLDAGEMVDDALSRWTHSATTFLRKNFRWVQWVLIGAVVAGVGYQIYDWRRAKADEKAADALMAAVEAQAGRVGDAPPAEEALIDPKPTFSTDAARLKEAAEGYEKAAALDPGSGSAILAQLGLAGVRYDQGKHDEAIKAYEAVKGSPLAQHDSDVKGRAIEGIGLALEAKGDSEGALKAYRELENMDEIGFKALALYHQARLKLATGKKDDAKELLAKARERLPKLKAENVSTDYLELALREIEFTIDPASARGSGLGYMPEQLEALQKAGFSLEEIEAIKKNPKKLSEMMAKDPTKLQQLLQQMQQSVQNLNQQLPQPPPGGGMPPVPLPEMPPPTAPASTAPAPAPPGSAP